MKKKGYAIRLRLHKLDKISLVQKITLELKSTFKIIDINWNSKL